jgi:thymidylate synthase
VGDFVWTGGDCHIYQNHFKQVNQQLERQTRDLPKLEMPNFSTLEELINTQTGDYRLIGYNPMDSIKAPMAI